MEEEHGAARSTDPQTSHDAAKRESVGKIFAEILEQLRHSPHGMTNWELTRAIGRPYSSITPRMVKLEEKGHIYRSGPRFSENGYHKFRNQTVWNFISTPSL